MSNRLVNYEKTNPEAQRVIDFSEGNIPIFARPYRASITNRPSWIVDFLNKQRGNFLTNKQVGYVSFYNDYDIFRSQYGAIEALNTKYPFFYQDGKIYVAQETFEMSSEQYLRAGQPKTEFDTIDLIVAQGFDSDIQSALSNGFYQLTHALNDTAVFTGVGYKKVSGLVTRFYAINSPRNKKRTISGAAVLDLGGSQSDVNPGSSLSIILSTGTITRELDHKEKIESTQVRFFENAEEWVAYIVDDIKENVSTPDYTGYVECIDKDGIELIPTDIIQLPSVIVDGVYEPSKVICNFSERYYQFGVVDSNAWKIVTHGGLSIVGTFDVIVVSGSAMATKITWTATSVTIQYDSDKYKIVDTVLEAIYENGETYGREYELGVLKSVGAQLNEMDNITTTISTATTDYVAVKKSGRLSYYAGTETNIKSEQSKLSLQISKNMFTGGVVQTTYMTGIDLEIERNRRSYATIMNKGWFETTPIGNGYPIKYAFVNRQGLPVKFASPSDYRNTPGLYLKVSGPLNVMSEINRNISLDDYNDDVISCFIIKNPRVNLGLNDSLSHNKYDSLNATDTDQFFDRQNHFLFDLIGGTRDGSGVVYELTLPSYGQNAALFSGGKMKIVGCGFKTEIIRDTGGNITGDNEYLIIYTSNYSEDSAGKQSVDLSGHIDLTALQASGNLTQVSKEKFYPMLRLPGVQGYVKLVAKNNFIPRVFSPADSRATIYDIEFPYAPGSFLERSTMDYQDPDVATTIKYADGFIEYKKSYTKAGSEKVYTDGAEARSERANERSPLFGQSVFSKSHLTMNSTSPVVTNYANNGGGETSESKIRKTIKYWPDAVKRVKAYDYVESAFQADRCVYVSPVLSAAPVEDVNLFLLVDNRKWVYDTDKFTPYIGRENPAYIMEMDASDVLTDIRDLSLYHRAAPDQKRFLFANTIAQAATAAAGVSIPSNESGSDVILEIWDNKAQIGPGKTGGMWRRFSPSVFDSKKIPSQKVIVTNLAYKDNQAPGYPIQTAEFCEFDMVYYEDREGRGAYKIELPPEMNNPAFFDDIENAVFYDKRNEASYHLVDIKWIEYFDEFSQPDPSQNFVRVKLRASSVPNIVSDGMLDSNDNFNVGEVDIREPVQFISKGGDLKFDASYVMSVGVPKYSLTSQILDPEKPIRTIRRFLDMKEIGNTVNYVSDLDRYFDNGKVRFRVRVNRNNEHPTTWVDDPNLDEFQYFDTYAPDSNNPFITLGVYDSILDWNKIGLSENIIKLGLGYFAMTSR